MASVTLQVSMAGPAENAGTCRVLYQIVNADGVAPEIFVVKRNPPPYIGGTPGVSWEHVAYADELSTVPVSAPASNTAVLLRKAVVTIEYTSIEKAETAIRSIRFQIQRLMNELKTLDIYSETNTYIISSTN